MQGEISREFTVWCAKCVEWHQVSARTQTIAIKEFKQVGWKKTKDGWTCESCLSNQK